MSNSARHDYKELRKLPNINSSKFSSDSTYVESASKRKTTKMTLEAIVASKLRISNVYIREGLAEFLGTFILIAFGCGVNAQTTLGKGTAGEFLSVNWGWALGIAFGVYVSGAVSGGHINPAVTLAMALLGRLPVRKVPIYWLAQYLGAFVASACVFGVYQDALDNYDGGVRSVTGPNATAGIWGTYPQVYVSIWNGLGDQIFGTTMLVLCVMSVTDSKNSLGAPKGLIPLIVGLIVFAIGLAYGLNGGFAINPARDFGPRAFTACAGWGSETFSAYDYYFWVPIVGPHIGAICGAFLYLLTVGFHLQEVVHEEVVYDDDKKTITLQGVRYIKSDGEKNRYDDSLQL